jgi:hypothetical protein
LRLWYKKKKIIFQDIYLTKQEGPKGLLEEILSRKLIVEPEVESKEEPTKEHEENPRQGHKKEQKYKELNDSKEPHVEEFKQEEPIAKFYVYHHPHHLEKQ